MSISKVVSDAAFKVARAEIDNAGYGFLVSDDKVRMFADPVAEAAVKAALEEARPGITNPKQPLAPK